ncbi:protein penguin [Harpegnathos saltator]|uniref:Pumilio domain-containing protein KIAA0020-like protein n=1 Tax=Harpegnathos saltator TaxID=610380 RepID=E2BXL1_HARSA|nr:protein penguin [Harpegnathos saltator]EFN79580.1 Pumilio domain-containing protein KIAA0020-like protein [Harpegnathos saltator]
MKQEVKKLNSENDTAIKRNIEEATNSGKKKKKKVKCEISQNKKPIDQNVKKPAIKKGLEKKNSQAAKHKMSNSADGGKKKKVTFEIPLNKNTTGQSVKKPPAMKKDSKKKDSKAAKYKITSEKTDWLKLKKEKKELKKTRKVKKLNDDKLYNLILQAKQINEKLRRSDCTQEDRKKLTQTLHNRLEGLYSKIIFTHDMSRIIQCLIKHCEADVREAIFCEIKSSILEMSQAKYAKNCVRAILKYGSQKIRNEIATTFYGSVVKLMSHTVSAPLIELVYSSWCKDHDKIYFKQEFYGDMYKQAKDKSVKTLSDVFEAATNMKPATLSAVKTNLVRILNKGLINSTLLHTILWEFFCVCSVEDRSELIVMLRDSIVALAQTKMGAKVAVQCIWHGNNKDRKIILKAFKENVKSVSTSEHGYMTFLALFDSMDDTVMIKKIILTELQKDLTDIALNEYGRRVILYLVARRDSHYFPPNVVEYLRQGDNNSTSKKPVDVREKELLEAIKDSLLTAITIDAATWLSNSAIAMVTLAILKVGSGEKLPAAFESIAKFISKVDLKIEHGDAECSAVEHPGLHMMLKKLIQNDKELLKMNESTFGEILTSHLTAEVLKKWIKFNRACFLLVLLTENESEKMISMLVTKLKPLVQRLKLEKSSGASILLKKII